MNKTLKHFFLLAMTVLCALPAVAQLNGTGYYRMRNSADGQTGDYISFANNKFDYVVIIDNAAGGFNNLTDENGPGRVRALTCASRYMQTGIALMPRQSSMLKRKPPVALTTNMT